MLALLVTLTLKKKDFFLFSNFHIIYCDREKNKSYGHFSSFFWDEYCQMLPIVRNEIIGIVDFCFGLVSWKMFQKIALKDL